MEEVSVDKVEALVRSGMEIETKHIMDLKAIKKIHGDLNARMDQIIGSGGKVETVATPEGKAKSFRKTVDKFISLSADALLDGDYLRQVDLDLWRQLKAKIEEIERKLFLSPNDPLTLNWPLGVMPGGHSFQKEK